MLLFDRLKESCKDPDYPSTTNCSRRFWVAGKVDNLQSKLNNISDTLRDIGPVWKNQFISLFAFLPWWSWQIKLMITMINIQVRVCQRLADPGGGEGDQTDVVSLDARHHRCSNLGVCVALHPLQLRHHYRSNTQKIQITHNLFNYKCQTLNRALFLISLICRKSL